MTTESTDELRYEVDGGVATITLNRPERMNTVTLAMMGAWRRALEAARLDDAVKVVIVTGTGDRAFCAGADLSGGTLGADEDATPSSLAQRKILRDYMHGVARELRLLDKPYLAAVNGAAVGVGMDIASMADLRFCTDAARFSMAYVKVGVVPGDGGAFYLPRILGLPRALHLIWTGEMFDAGQALEWGYVHAVHPADTLMKEVRSYAERLAAGPSVAIGLAKRMVYQGLETTEEHALEFASAVMPLVLTSDDAKEGPAAFGERRPPKFTGR